MVWGFQCENDWKREINNVIFNLGAQISMGCFIEFNDRNDNCSIFNLLNYL